MASLNGGAYLFNGSVANSATSALVNIGSGPWVALYVTNTSNLTATFKIQVAGTPLPHAGRNVLDGTADGGLTWFDYIPAGETSTPSISLALNAAVCYDLSPFAPEYVCLLRTDANGTASIVAMITSCGPN